MNKLYVGARVRIYHKFGLVKKNVIVDITDIGSWKTEEGFYIDKDGKAIRGKGNRILAIVELLNPIKKYKYKYKKK